MNFVYWSGMAVSILLASTFFGMSLNPVSILVGIFLYSFGYFVTDAIATLTGIR